MPMASHPVDIRFKAVWSMDVPDEDDEAAPIEEIDVQRAPSHYRLCSGCDRWLDIRRATTQLVPLRWYGGDRTGDVWWHRSCRAAHEVLASARRLELEREGST